MAENQTPNPKPASKPISVGFIPETRIGQISGGNLSGPAASQYFRGQNVSRINSEIASYERRLEEIKLANARRASEIDNALSVASKINLESTGAQLPSTPTAKLEVAGAPKGSILLDNGTVKLPNGKIISNTAPVKASPGIDPVGEEKQRSKGIIDQTYGIEDPLSDELDKKIGQLTENYLNAKKAPHTNLMNATYSMGTVRANTDFTGINKLGEELENLKKQQAIINQYKSDLQIKKATEDYIANLKAKGQSFNSSTSKGLIDQVKLIKAQERNRTRGDVFYDNDVFESYKKEGMGTNDFIDYNHTDRSIASLMKVLSEEMQVADPQKANELQGALKEVQRTYNTHAKSNEDAYDYYYGTSQRYREAGALNKAGIYTKTQILQPIVEGLSNFILPFVPGVSDYSMNNFRDKWISGDMILADLDGDNRITERDRDQLGNYQYLGQNFTYTKEKIEGGKKVKSTEYMWGSLLGTSIRTVSEMAPTLLITRGLMGAGVGARLATFVPVAASSALRSYDQNKKNYKSKLDAFNVGLIQGVIEGLTESIVPDIGYFMGSKSLATKSLSAAERKAAVTTALLPEFNKLSVAARSTLLAAGSAIKQTTQEGLEEEISMFANYALNQIYKTKDDMYGELPEELDATSLETIGSSMWKTFAESAAAGAIMTGSSVYSSKKIDDNLIRFNVATNPRIFKEELTKLRDKGEITKDQYSRAILEGNRLTQLKESADRVMLNLVDPETLLEDSEKQFGYFSALLQRSDLLVKKGLDFEKMDAQQQEQYISLVENVEKEIDNYENLALKYAESTPEEREQVLEKMITRNIKQVSETNNPAALKANEEALAKTIMASELSGKGSSVMRTGRDQMMEAIQRRKQQLQSIEDNGNTVFENQLLNTPIEDFGQSMQIAKATELALLLRDNSENIRQSVFKQLNDKIESAVRLGQQQLSELSKKEQKKVLAKELARLETIRPGITFDMNAVNTVFNIQLTDQEHKEVVDETVKEIVREDEKIEDTALVVPDEKDPAMSAAIANFQKEPEFIQQENEQGEVVNVPNKKRKEKIAGAIRSLNSSKSKQQLKSRFTSLFSALGFDAETVNKGLEDLNSLLDGKEPTNPGELYRIYLNVVNAEKLKNLPLTNAEVAPVEITTGEEEVITPPAPVSDITLPEVVVVEPPTDLPAEVVPAPPQELFDGLPVEKPTPENAEQTGVSSTSPTVFASSNAGTQSEILRTVNNKPESYVVKVMDLFSFIKEAVGKRALGTLQNIYKQVGQAIDEDNQEGINALKEEFMAIFPEGTFSKEMLEYIWNNQFVQGKPDASLPTVTTESASAIQIATTYKNKEGIIEFVKGNQVIKYSVELTGKVVNGKLEAINKKSLKIVYVDKNSFKPYSPVSINARAEFFQINSIVSTIANKSNNKITKFNLEGKKDSKGKVNALMFLPQKDPTAIRLRGNIVTNTPVTFTGSIVGGTKISNKGNYEKSKTSVYISFDNSGHKNSLTPQISLGLDNQEPIVQEDVTPTSVPEVIVPSISMEDAKADIERRRKLSKIVDLDTAVSDDEINAIQPEPGVKVTYYLPEGKTTDGRNISEIPAASIERYTTETKIFYGFEEAEQQAKDWIKSKYDAELAALESNLPVVEDAVVTTLPTNLLNILTENITGKMGSSQNNPITPAQENDQEDAASCSIKNN